MARAQQLELYTAMATPITHRATSLYGDFEPSNLGLTLGGRWHVNPSWFVAAEVSFLQDQPLLQQTDREQIFAIRSFTTPALGIGKVADMGRWRLQAIALGALRLVGGQGVRVTAGGASARGAFIPNQGLVDPMSVSGSTTGTNTPALPSLQVGLGVGYRISPRIHLIGEMRIGYDLTSYDPNIYAKVTHYNPAATTQPEPLFVRETRFRQGSVSRLYVYTQGGVTIRIGRKPKPDTYVP